jgi:hypothetical protein
VVELSGTEDALADDAEEEVVVPVSFFAPGSPAPPSTLENRLEPIDPPHADAAHATPISPTRTNLTNDIPKTSLPTIANPACSPGSSGICGKDDGSATAPPRQRRA